MMKLKEMRVCCTSWVLVVPWSLGALVRIRTAFVRCSVVALFLDLPNDLG